VIKSATPNQAQVALKRDRLFACAGYGDHGIVAELRQGIEAKTLDTVDILAESVREVWTHTLPGGSNNLIMISFYWEETALYLLSQQTAEVEEIKSRPNLQIGQGYETLTSDVVGNHLIQVTTEGITMADLHYPSSDVSNMEVDEMGDHNIILDYVLGPFNFEAGIVAASLLRHSLLYVQKDGAHFTVSLAVIGQDVNM